MATRCDDAQARPPGRSSHHPGVFDPRVVANLERTLGPISRSMWPSSFTGLEHLPDHDRFMVVANHSGMGVAELVTLALGWHARFGGARKVAGMAHPGAFLVPPLNYFLPGLGAVEATREGAAWARQHGAALLAFPGGDHEVSRPLWRAQEVDFAGRKGWIRLAREYGLTIVPMAITGSHETLPIFAHGRAVSWIMGVRGIGLRRAPLPALSLLTAPLGYRLARAVGLPRWASGVVGWLSMWPTIGTPWIPSRIGFHLMPPIAPSRFADPAQDSVIYGEVVSLLGRALRDEPGTSMSR
jgi:1-acyl-sn-glycerol-3-phosphate acyltransferase